MSTLSIADADGDGDADVDAEWQQLPAHSTSSTGQRALLCVVRLKHSGMSVD